jgi:cytochrome c-type biogenesis protein CcmH/NrfF
MAAIWFWPVMVLLVVLGTIFWVVFLRKAPRKRKSDELDDMLFERENRPQ